MPAASSSATSALVPPSAFWWQWPCSSALPPIARRLPVARLQEFAEGDDLPRQLRGVAVAGEEFQQLVLEDRMAAGLEDDDGHARFDLRRERGEDFLQARFRLVEHAVVVVRPAAAQALLRQLDARARGFQHARRRQAVCGRKKLVKVSGKRITGSPRRTPPSRAGSRRPRCSASNCERKLRSAKRGNGRSAAMPAIRFRTLEKPGKPVIALTRFGARMASGAHSPMRPMECACSGRGAMLVVVRQELGLVARHVGVRGAVAAAALAGEAHVQRLLHLFALPAVR